MKEKNIRRYPPIFVSSVIAIAFFAISATAIAGGARVSTEAMEKGAGITYAEKTEVMENAFTVTTAPGPYADGENRDGSDL